MGGEKLCESQTLLRGGALWRGGQAQKREPRQIPGEGRTVAQGS